MTLRFRPERRPVRGRVGAFVAVAGLVGVALLTRSLWEPGAPEGDLVEVVGDVPRPGLYSLPDPTLHAALQAAGAPVVGPDATITPGNRVVVEGGAARIEPPGDPLLVALPVDLNAAGVDAFAAIPGVGAGLAEAIVADREVRGVFYAVSDLGRVAGIGPSKVDAVRPFVSVGDVGPRPPVEPVDLNRATVGDLERLAGIGPVTAARIVVDREDNGPFQSVDDLGRVHGVGPKTVDAIRHRVTVSQP